jgi:hypothetical protein
MVRGKTKTKTSLFIVRDQANSQKGRTKVAQSSGMVEGKGMDWCKGVPVGGEQDAAPQSRGGIDRRQKHL